MPRNIRLLIADDNQTVRTDLRMVLELVEGLEITGEAAAADEVIGMAETLLPDLVLIDLEMNRQIPLEMDGCRAIRKIKALQPSPAVFVLTVHGYPTAENAARQAGADAFFVKGRDFQSLLEQIQNLDPEG